MTSINLDRNAVARQVRQYLDLLRDAGVEFLPAPSRTTPSVEVSAFSRAEAPAAEPASGNSLFAPAAEPAASEDERLRSLAVLQDEVRQCMACPELCSTRTQTVFGVGPMDVELCFVGEAPGADEDRQGEPFVGAAGQLLTRIIEAMGLRREEVYICNILKCRPPGNRPPKVDEAANCRGFLDRQLELIRPSFICCLGFSAAKYLLNSNLAIGKMRGRFYDYNGIPVICTYHPASLLPTRSPENKRLVWEDMKMLLQKMGRPIPQPKSSG